MSSVLIERVPQFEIRDGLVHVDFGGDHQPMCLPIRTFQLAVAFAQEVLAKWQCEQMGAVPKAPIPIRSRRKKR